MAPWLPSQEELDAMNNEWCEPNDPAAAPGFTYALYDTKVRGENKQSSYWYSLPEGYEENPSATYPVLIWLHGGMSRASRDSRKVYDLYKPAMKAGTMPPTILILPQALPVGWYINSIDYTFPIEDVMIKDFIPHIDATFRTNGKRGIEGFSMGGYGASHLGFTYSELFQGISAVAPAILPSLDNEPKERVWDTFRGDQSYYDKNHPAHLLKEKKETLRSSGVLVRLVSGGDDTRLTTAIENLAVLMDEAGVEHYRKDVPGAGHEYDLIVGGLGDDAFTFWAKAFD